MLAQEDQEEPANTVQVASSSQHTRNSLQYVAGAACVTLHTAIRGRCSLCDDFYD